MKKTIFLLAVLVLLFGLISCDTNDEVVTTVESISLVEGYKTAYTVGDELDLSTLKILVSYY